MAGAGRHGGDDGETVDGARSDILFNAVKKFLGGMNVMPVISQKIFDIFKGITEGFVAIAGNGEKIGEFLIFFGDAFASVNISRHLLNATVNQSDSFRITFELS